MNFRYSSSPLTLVLTFVLFFCTVPDVFGQQEKRARDSYRSPRGTHVDRTTRTTNRDTRDSRTRDGTRSGDTRLSESEIEWFCDGPIYRPRCGRNYIGRNPIGGLSDCNYSVKVYSRNFSDLSCDVQYRKRCEKGGTDGRVYLNGVLVASGDVPGESRSLRGEANWTTPVERLRNSAEFDLEDQVRSINPPGYGSPRFVNASLGEEFEVTSEVRSNGTLLLSVKLFDARLDADFPGDWWNPTGDINIEFDFPTLELRGIYDLRTSSFVEYDVRYPNYRVDSDDAGLVDPIIERIAGSQFESAVQEEINQFNPDELVRDIIGGGDARDLVIRGVGNAIDFLLDTDVKLSVRGNTDIGFCKVGQLTVRLDVPASTMQKISGGSTYLVKSGVSSENKKFRAQAATQNGYTTSLGSSYPNPVSQQQVTLPIEIADRTPVTIKIFDVLGRRVATPVDRTMSSGKHEVQISTTDLAPGTYIYQMEAGDFVESRRLTVVR